MRNGRFGLWCALAFFAGCVLALERPISPHEDLLIDLVWVGAFAGFTLTLVLRRRARAMGAVAVLSVMMLGWAHAGHAWQREPDHSLIDRVDDQPELVRFEAELVERFSPPDAADTDLLDRFQPDADDPPWKALAELRCQDGRHGRIRAAGLVSLVAPDTARALEQGDVVTGVGWLSGVQAPRNPGEPDLRDGAWRRGMVGRLKMDVAPTRVGVAPAWMHARTLARQWVDANLIGALQPHAPTEVQTLVVAMTTGRRLPGYATLRATFAQTEIGRAHV